MTNKEVLRRRRVAMGLSLQSMGELVGVSAATLLRWERGDGDLSAYKLRSWQWAMEAAERQRDATADRSA